MNRVGRISLINNVVKGEKMERVERLRNKLLMFLKLPKPRYAPTIRSLVDLLTLTSALVVIVYMVRSLLYKTIKEHYLWITSPHGKHYKLPTYQAIRILRKRKDWQPAEVEPILTKWQMAKRIVGM